uniref:Uncharacterized protein n=1 Tax=Glossina palpalis gambiensis TaxID=67801 RepID=A0A1B0AP53_9MUSC
MYIRAVEIVALAVLHCFPCTYIIRMAPCVRFARSSPLFSLRIQIFCKTIASIEILTRPLILEHLTKNSCIIVNWWSKSSSQSENTFLPCSVLISY